MSDVDKTIYNSFEQELVDNGYKIFKDNLRNSIRGFQKRFEDKKGIKYFITIYHYNHKKQYPNWDGAPESDRYTFTNQFSIDENNKDISIDVSYFADMLPNEYRSITTLKEAEQFFEDFFIKFNIDYYEKI